MRKCERGGIAFGEKVQRCVCLRVNEFQWLSISGRCSQSGFPGSWGSPPLKREMGAKVPVWPSKVFRRERLLGEVPDPNVEVEECGDVATPAWAKGLQDRGVPPAEFLKNSSS